MTKQDNNKKEEIDTETYHENSFYYLANDIKDQIIDEKKTLERDLTDLFYKEIEYMITNGEIVIIEINAKMRLGKSTQAIALGMHIFELLKKHKHQPATAQFTINNIARDQQEKSKLMRDPDLSHTVIVTDENNELEKTGANATTESALMRVFSDVQAGRYIHSVNCSPKETIDTNADIILQITSLNKHNRSTNNKLYYRFTEGGITRILLLGYVVIDVSKVIEVWENKAKKLYFKRRKTDKEKTELQNLINTDLYTCYQYKKYEKMELITKEGILRPRMLDTAEVALTVIKKLKDLTKIIKITPTFIRSLLNEEIRKNKLAISLVGEEQLIKDVLGVIGTYQEINMIILRQKMLTKKYMNKELDNYTYDINKDQLQQALITLKEIADNQVKELEHYANIKRKYETTTQNE